VRRRSDHTERGVKEVAPLAQPPEQAATSADIGEAVTGILRAAEETAERIRSEAKNQAREIIEGAHVDASARIQELVSEAERTRSEADDYARDVRVAVDGYGTQQRREADEEARQILADAEEQARATAEAAQDVALQIEGEARGRLHEEVRSLEERRTQIVHELSELAAHLSDLIPESDPIARETELLDALEVERPS
jgi:F0F1-type ATP synthase membrane subunit b/b'